MHLEGLYDEKTGTITYVVLDKVTMACALIDSVLDFEMRSGRTATRNADKAIALIEKLGGSLQWILETHIHADHLTAAPYIKEKLGGAVAVGSGITQVQRNFSRVFSLSEAECSGARFDKLFEDGEEFSIGTLKGRVLHTPGHTPACVTYVVHDDAEQVAFVGDALFMPDFGTARCDFPGGSASQLYGSIQKILALPPQTLICTGHDYQPNGRELRYQCSVEEQRQKNVHVGGARSEMEFVAMRNERDSGLALPELLIPSVQVNMRAGEVAATGCDGIKYIQVPLNVL